MLSLFPFLFLYIFHWAILGVLLLAQGLPGAQAQEPFPRATVKIELLPVYVDTGVSSGIVKFLRKGDQVEVMAETKVAGDTWCGVKEAGRGTMLGFVNCNALEYLKPREKSAQAEEKKPPAVLALKPESLQLLRPPATPKPAPKTKDSPPFGEFLQALWKEDIQAVKDFLDRGIDPNQATAYGNRPLLIAAKKRNPVLLKVLIEKGAEVNGKDRNGLTALIAAASMGHVSNVEILIQAGADVNIKDNKGLTPLMWATMQGHADVVEILLAHGAETKTRTTEGMTAERMSQIIIADLKRSLADAEKAGRKELVSKLKGSIARHERVQRLFEAIPTK